MANLFYDVNLDTTTLDIIDKFCHCETGGDLTLKIKMYFLPNSLGSYLEKN